MFSHLITALPLFALPISALTVLEDVLTDGVVTAEKMLGEYGPDSPKLTPITSNISTYEWWYFDAISQTTDASVTVVFYNSGPDGFVNDYLSGPFSVALNGAFENGTVFDIAVDSTGGLILDYESDGSITGQWIGADNVSFTGTALTDYTIDIDAPGVGVTGSITFQSLAPPHFACGLDSVFYDEVMIPHMWWSNTVPDAVAVVDLVVGGTPLAFSDGIGYHDKNWGDANFLGAVDFWYWGHARVGPYSVVWFDGIDADGFEDIAGYVSKDGEALSASCATGAVVVRPWGANSTYPPELSTGIMEGLEANFTLDDGSVLTMNITTGIALVDNQNYVRTLGKAVGGIVGGDVYTDVPVIYEEFKFTS